jgi:regulatory protein
LEVTALTPQVKNPDRINIHVDGSYLLSLTMNQVLSEKITVGLRLNELRVKQLKKLSDIGKLRHRVLEWSLMRPRSTLELRRYVRSILLKKRYDITDEDAQEVIGQCLAKSYVNDEVFAEWWVGRTAVKKKSLVSVRASLAQKGIKASVAAAYLDGIDEKEAIRTSAKKLMKRTKYSKPEEMVRALMMRGFRYSDIVSALAEIDEAD